MNQSKVEIYVKSSALGPDGIHWRNISKPEQPKEQPSILERQLIPRMSGNGNTEFRSIDGYLNYIKPGIVLARYDNKLLLQLIGLNANQERSQKLGRRISDHILWIGDDDRDIESQFRKIAAILLVSVWQGQSSLLTQIANAIEFDGLNDFKTNSQAIEELLYIDANQYLDDIVHQVITYEDGDSDWSNNQTIATESQLYDLVRWISTVPLPAVNSPVVLLAQFKTKAHDTKNIVYEIYQGDIYREKNQEKKTLAIEKRIITDITRTQEPPTVPATPTPNNLKIVIWLVVVLLVVVLLVVGVLYLLGVPYPPR